MKKFYAAAACMIFVAAVSGCSDKKSNSSGKETEKIVSPRTVTFEWQESYKAKLEEFRNSENYQESNGIIGSMFDLRDLNSDGIPELIISPSDGVDSVCTIYTYYDGSLTEIGTNGNNGFFAFYPSAGIINNEFQGSGFVMGEFRRIEGSSFMTEMTYYNNIDSVNSGAVIRYEIDKEEVLPAEYNEKFYSYADQPSLTVGRKYTFGECTMDYAVYCSESWDDAASSSMKKLFKKKVKDLAEEYEYAGFELLDMNGDECPELIFSEGFSSQDSCRVFVYSDGELVELSEKCGINGRFGFDNEKMVFFTINPQDVDKYGSLTDISLDGYEKSGSLMECGRKYLVSDETALSIFD